MKFRKRPVVIEAYRFNPAERASYVSVLEYSEGGKGVDCKWGIQTLEGMMEVRVNDWVITGIQGEHYPCKPDIFEATYYEVSEQTLVTTLGEIPAGVPFQ